MEQYGIIYIKNEHSKKKQTLGILCLILALVIHINLIDAVIIEADTVFYNALTNLTVTCYYPYEVSSVEIDDYGIIFYNFSYSGSNYTFKILETNRLFNCSDLTDILIALRGPIEHTSTSAVVGTKTETANTTKDVIITSKAENTHSLTEAIKDTIQSITDIKQDFIEGGTTSEGFDISKGVMNVIKNNSLSMIIFIITLFAIMILYLIKSRK